MIGSVRTSFLSGLAVLLAAVAGCARDSDVPSERVPTVAGIGDYPGFADLDPIEVVRRYVGALNARDGRSFCRAVAPWISGRYDLATKDRDSELAHLGGGCPRVSKTFIGFVGDTGTSKFLRAEMEDAEVAGDGGLRRVDLRVTLLVERVHENGRRVRDQLDDVVWLARVNGAWRVAKLSKLARAAGLAGESSTRDPLARPDIDEDRRAYVAELRRFQEYDRGRERSYRAVGKPADCSGGVSVDDPRGDPRDYNFPSPKTPLPRSMQIDLRQVQVRRDGWRICVAFTMWGDAQGPLTASFNMRDSAAGTRFIQIFDLELSPDGTTRVTSGKDDEDRPISVPAVVGRAGGRLTLQLNQRSFEKGRPIPATRPNEPPPRNRFAFMASAQAAAGGRRAAHDDLGPDPVPTSFGYPSGRRCDLRRPVC